MPPIAVIKETELATTDAIESATPAKVPPIARPATERPAIEIAAFLLESDQLLKYSIPSSNFLFNSICIGINCSPTASLKSPTDLSYSIVDFVSSVYSPFWSFIQAITACFVSAASLSSSPDAKTAAPYSVRISFVAPY